MKHRLISMVWWICLAAGFLVRMYEIKTPLADWHSFRQADTASVAREYVKHGINLLVPTYHDLSNIQSGEENPNGYRMVEFPIVSGLVAFLYRTIPGMQTYELHVVYRIINVLFSLLSAYLLFKIISKAESPFTGLLAAAVFLFLPYNIYYSRAILPEPAMITAILGAIYLGVRGNLIGAGLMSGLALLIKPTAVFFLLPLIPMYIKRKNVWIMVLGGILAVGPLLWWRNWISGFPAGIPASDWLLNGNNIRFKGAWFYWLFADRLGRLILGYWGILLMGMGILATKKNALVGWWVVGSLLYLTVFASGNVQHDYYQIPLVPVVSVLVAYGIQLMRRLPVSPLKQYAVMAVTLTFMVGFSWYFVRDYYHINNWAIVRAGGAVRQHTAPDSLVIAPYMGDTAFLYQTDRRGWPIGFNIEKRIDQGADYYVSTSYDDEARELEQKYQLVEKTDDYILIRLATN